MVSDTLDFEERGKGSIKLKLVRHWSNEEPPSFMKSRVYYRFSFVILDLVILMK